MTENDNKSQKCYPDGIEKAISTECVHNKSLLEFSNKQIICAFLLCRRVNYYDDILLRMYILKQMLHLEYMFVHQFLTVLLNVLYWS